MFKRYLILLIVGGLAMAGSLSAAEEPADLFTLGEIVVKGEAGDVSDIGVSQTFSFEEIQATNSSTIADAMKFVPGVTMSGAARMNRKFPSMVLVRKRPCFSSTVFPTTKPFMGS